MIKEQITFDKSNNQLLYFTSSSLLDRNKGIVFISDRTGKPNLFYKDFNTEQENQLTFQDDGIMKSYVYFDGTPYKGFGKASVSLHSESGNIYYIQGKNVMKVNINGISLKLCELPDGQMTGFTDVSSDGTLLCIPTVDERALDVKEDLQHSIDKRVQEEGLNSYIRIYNTQTGVQVKCEKVNRAWITHVQFSPINNEYILYNHEWASNNCGIRRLWLWNGKEHIRLRQEDSTRSAKDWVCHEMWEKNGKYVIYHGGYNNGSCFVGHVNINDLSYNEIAINPFYKAYGHFTVNDTGALVSDGYYCEQNDTDNYWAGKWISVQKIDWGNKKMQWIPLCKHESSWNSQCSHPHPIFNQNDKYIYFTSDISGYRQIYRVASTICS